MGLFDFVKEAGEKLFGSKEEAAPSAPPAGVSSEEARKAVDRRRAAALVTFIEKMGLKVDDLSVRVDGETAKVSGKVASQELREKIVLAVGNVAGIARVDDQLTVEKAEPEATFYTVVRGDTLSKIAKAHYGNAMKYPVIFEANRPLLQDPDKIYPGQVLRIPPLA